jgi:hypothetical protein
MTSRSHTTATIRAASHRFPIVVAISLALGWIWLVAGIRLHEMLVGFVVVVAATLFISIVQRSSTDAISPQWRDVAQGWRIPWYILSKVWEITVVLIKDLFYVRRANSYYRVCGFKSSKRDQTRIAREVLATLFTTAAPNFIVIGIDPEMGRMLFHQIERTSVSEMTRALGAQS